MERAHQVGKILISLRDSIVQETSILDLCLGDTSANGMVVNAVVCK